MRTFRVLVAAILAQLLSAFVAFAGDGSDGPGPSTIVVKHDPLSATGGIQEAIDALGAGGGTVTIPSGEYLLRQSIRVRNHVTLQGSGEGTVLRKGKQVGSKLAARIGDQDRSVRVQSVSGFQPGDEIGIYDGSTVGWLHSHAIVKEVGEDELLLDRRVMRVFEPEKGGAVINYFPAITGRGLVQVVIKDLMIDGQREENPGLASVSMR